MVNLVIRDLPDETKEQLSINARLAGLSLEEYARKILEEASTSQESKPINIVELAKMHFGSKNGVKLKLPKRGTKRLPVDFDK